MNTLLTSLTLSFAFIAAGAAHAQAPAAAPAGSTGACKDGTYTSADSKKGACRGHKGVKEWYAAASSTSNDDTATKKSSRASKADTASAAPAPSAAPAGSTGSCKDGSYTSAESKKGACRGHKGVKEWYGDTSAAPAAPTKAAPMAKPAPTTTPAPMPKPAPTTMPAPAPTAMPTPAPTTAQPSTTTAAAGGGNGKVWVNSETKVYHCPSDRYYGKTKQGEYMSEADAIAKGNHASHGKVCTP